MEAITDTCSYVRNNCCYALYTIEMLRALDEHIETIRKSAQSNQFWGITQKHAKDMLIVTIAKIFDTRGKKHLKHTFRVLLENTSPASKEKYALSEDDENFIKRIDAYRDKYAAHQDAIPTSQLNELCEDSFWPDVFSKSPELLKTALKLAEHVASNNGTMLDIDFRNSGYKDTLAIINSATS